MNILETDRLIIRELTLSDADFIFELVNTPSWIRYIGDKGVRTREDARGYIRNGPLKSYEQFGFGLYLVQLREGKLAIGICGLLKRDTLADVDIGFALLPRYEGKGFAFEAASATLQYARSSLGLQRIVAITDSGNDRSISLLKRLGLHFKELLQLGKDGKEVMLFVS